MTVKGLGSPGTPPLDPRRADNNGSAQATGASESASSLRLSVRRGTSEGDVLELSADAAQRPTGMGVPPRDTLPVDRIKAIAARIADGSYDRPEVQDVVLARLAQGLDSSGDSVK